MSRILLVEDDPVISVVMTRVMTNAGHVVIHAKNGLAAIEYLSTDEFDVLVTDLKMGRLDGQELCHWTREDPSLATLPILVTTGIIDPAELARLDDIEFLEVLAKPIKTELLLERIDFYTGE